MNTNAGERKGTVSYQKEAAARATSSVVLESAPGAALGPDGFFHPTEVDPKGNLRAADSALLYAITELTAEIRALRQGLAIAGSIPDVR